MLIRVLKYISLVTGLALTVFILHVGYVLYEEAQVKNKVEEIFNRNKYQDINLIVCLEEKCLYSFGDDKKNINIYTVGRDDIENRIELARHVAKNWPNENKHCKTFSQGSCQL